MMFRIFTTAIVAGALLSTTSFGYAQTKKQQDSLNARAQVLTTKPRPGTVPVTPSLRDSYMQTFDANAPGAGGSGGGAGSSGGGSESSGGAGNSQ